MDHNELYYWVNNVCFKHFLNKGLHKRWSDFEVATIYFHINFHVSIMTALLFFCYYRNFQAWSNCLPNISVSLTVIPSELSRHLSM